jgi:tetratricopeptide (TPR) repeat protein
MTTPDQDAQAGIELLRSGNAPAARDALVRAVQGGRADNAVLLGLARACRNVGDAGGAASALDYLLKLEPKNLVGLLARADLYDAAGDTRAASSFYSMALRVAPPASQLAANVFQDLRRAQATLDRYSATTSASSAHGWRTAGSTRRPPARAFATRSTSCSGRRRSTCSSRSTTTFPTCRRSSSTSVHGSRGWAGSRPRPTRSAPSCST